MKNCIIIHGCPSDNSDPTYSQHWIPWVKSQLITQNIPTETPLMPEPWQPDYEKFKAVFERLTINPETILVGHSCGCTFLVRWLSETKKSVAKLILVAPWKFGADADAFRKAFYDFTIDPELAQRVDSIYLFTSNDEEPEGKAGLTMFHDTIGGTIIDLPNHGHYTQGDMRTEEFPELLQLIMS